MESIPLQDETSSADAPSGPVIHIDWIGGNCPVQAEGTINGAVFYFRARGKVWSIDIATDAGGVDSPTAWSHRERYSDPDAKGRFDSDPDDQDPYAAGWMSPDEARDFIAKAAELFANQTGRER
jgi:hypothetical protein